MKIFTTESLGQIVDYIIQHREKEAIEFALLNPDLGAQNYSGQIQHLTNGDYRYHSYKSLLDIAQFFHMRFHTPVIKNDLIIVRYTKLNPARSFHNNSDSCNKYGSDSEFAKIDKNNEAGFYLYYLQALKAVKITQRKDILNLGLNSGNELYGIEQLVKKQFKEKKIVGIDISRSALELAQNRYSSLQTYCHDINHLEQLQLPPFDLIISIGTLQTPSIDYDSVLRYLAKELLAPKGAIILGFPNCRWIDGEMVYGAKAPHYAYSELSLVCKDITFAKRFLQQRGFRVTITGKDYLFITATKLS
ncbi:MAG: class I SAM-dependent methyltransferase [Campylobacterota bacterium]